MNHFCAKIRYKLGVWAYRIILGKTVGGLPRSSVRSIDEVAYLDWVRCRLKGDVLIYGPSIQEYHLPKTYPGWFRKSKAFEGKKIFHLANVVAGPHTGLVWVPGEGILEESVGSLKRMMGWGSVRWESVVPPRPFQTKHPILPCTPTGYFHWMFEVLPNTIQALDYFPDALLLLPHDRPRYIDQSLHASLPEERVRILESNHPLAVERLVLPQVQVYSGFVDRRDIELLRERVLGKVEDSCRGERIYVSRKGARARPLGGTEEAEEYMRSKGFQVLCLEDLDFLDQVRVFSAAETIFAPHGAGLSNIVWCAEGTTVLEIFPRKYINDCYARLAVTLKLRYSYLVADADGTEWGRMPISELKSFVGSLPS